MIMATTVEITTTTVTNKNEVADLSHRADEARALWNEFQETKAAIKALEEKKAAADALLNEMLDGAEYAVIDGEKLFGLAHSSNTSYDGKLLAEAWPEAFKAVMRKKAYTFLKAM
jgi:CelD/BcsL family acetyltransferase involved in cellulose biosynthesis